MAKKKRLTFFCNRSTGTYRYEGYIVDQTDTHFIVLETKKNIKVHLPKSETTIEEVTE